MSAQHHRKCPAFGNRRGTCNGRCADVQRAIDAFNGDVTKTHRDNPDGRNHYSARFALMAEDCDYEIVGFSGVQGRML